MKDRDAIWEQARERESERQIENLGGGITQSCDGGLAEKEHDKGNP